VDEKDVSPVQNVSLWSGSVHSWVSYKRLEKDRFAWPRAAQEAVLRLNVEQLDWLLRGLDILRMKPHPVRSFDLI